MQFLKYAILFVSIILVLDLALYLVLNVRPASTPENNAVTNIFTTAGDFLGNAVETVQQNIADVQEKISERDRGTREKTPSQASNQTTQPTTQNNTQIQEEQTDACLDKFNLTSSTIIFYYSNDPHSNVMIPIVSDLDEIYKFHSTSNLWNYEFNQCFGLSGTMPAFVCAGSKEKIDGEVSKSVLEEFCKRC